MPFAGYKNFADCMSKLKGKYPNKETRQKVCGSLQAKHEKHEKIRKDIDKELELSEKYKRRLKWLRESLRR